MARRRMIDPCIWQSEDFSKLSLLARLIFIGMFSLADDEGKGRAKPIYLKSVIFPYDERVQIIDVEKALLEIGSNMSVTFYVHNENDYYRLNNWPKWQRVDKPQPSKMPDPMLVQTNSGIILESVESHSCLKEKKLREEKGKEKKENIYCPAEPDVTREIIAYLNQMAKTNYKPTSKTTKTHINARLNEGFSLDDFIVVIDKKVFEWGNDLNMAKFLRPQTLFGTKFESYLNQPMAKPVTKNEQAVINTLNYQFKGDYFDEE